MSIQPFPGGWSPNAVNEGVEDAWPTAQRQRSLDASNLLEDRRKARTTAEMEAGDRRTCNMERGTPTQQHWDPAWGAATQGVKYSRPINSTSGTQQCGAVDGQHAPAFGSTQFEVKSRNNDYYFGHDAVCPASASTVPMTRGNSVAVPTGDLLGYLTSTSEQDLIGRGRSSTRWRCNSKSPRSPYRVEERRSLSCEPEYQREEGTQTLVERPISATAAADDNVERVDSEIGTHCGRESRAIPPHDLCCSRHQYFDNDHVLSDVMAHTADKSATVTLVCRKCE